MSYDLILFEVPKGADAHLIYQEIIQQQECEILNRDSLESPPVSDAARAEMRRIADALRSWRPTLEEFRPSKPLPFIELNDNDLQIQFSIHQHTISVTLPYFRDRAQEILKCVTDCFDILNTFASYSAYDHQLGRIVTRADLAAMIAQYKSTDQLLPTLQDKSSNQPRVRKPWWKIW